MKCQNCGVDIGGKRYCPNCNAESSYEGATPGVFSKNTQLRKIVGFLFSPRTLFVIACIIVVVVAQ